MAVEPTAVSFVFPTRVGVDRLTVAGQNIPSSFPHTRGGGPYRFLSGSLRYVFSPHAWGWTVCCYSAVSRLLVFPTRVGVDLIRRVWDGINQSFPHTRGGGPNYFRDRRMSSPVFPTRVGVDLEQADTALSNSRFPHTRGGGP